MKKILFIFAIIATFSSCKQKEDTSKYETFTGDFLMTDEGAILENGNRIFGVVVNDVAKELGKKTKEVQKTEFDMVQVTVKGEVGPNTTGKEGWEEYLTIKEIMDIANKPSVTDIELKAPKTEENATN